MNKKDAVCVLIEKNELILAVARRGTTDQWGLPGGSVEHEETLKDAAVRELFEETGIIVNIKDLKEIYYRISDDIKVTTFKAENFTGFPRQGDAGPVQWISWDLLLSGPFGKYNAQVKNNKDK